MSITALENFLSSLSSKPILHVNGSNHQGAVLTVDFGEKSSEINTNVIMELSDLMRNATLNMVKRANNVKINHDSSHGIFWSSAF